MNDKFISYRTQYPNFIYNGYDIKEVEEELRIEFDFEIEGLTSFKPYLLVPKVDNINIDDEFFKNIVFNIGMVELLSYVKCTCSPNIIIKCGYLSEYQINWFKKLYYEGLGEFRYLNNIDISMDELFNITVLGHEKKISRPNYVGKGNLIPIGGGKDSCVSLELLRDYKEDNDCFIINPKPVTLACAQVAGYEQDKIKGVKRVIDKNLIDLNNKGFLNGHTPFSAIVAFVSYLIAYMNNKKYIVLSNEASANESTVIGTDINHQYSKTYEFEKDFNNYTHECFGIDLNYFSLLRPLSEFQIGMLFAHYKKYHKVFKSCNVGSKSEEWKWCCNCPKCLFVYTILSPFLTKEEMVTIFGSDMFDKKELLPTFLELLGYSETKPFECVGTYKEVRYAVSLAIQKRDNLPYLLQYYKDNYELELDHQYKKMFNTEHNLPTQYEACLRKEIDEYAR